MKPQLVLAIVFIVAVPALAFAQAGPVSLGVGAGAVVPAPADDGTSDVAVAWGFHVNIPIITSLHLSPSSLVYRNDGVYATDTSLAFKFIIPLRAWALYFGAAPGLTAAGTRTSAHVGALGGATLALVSNISGFAEYKYKVVFRDTVSSGFSHLTAGLVFSF
ncbi:MAG: hypothetical protein ACOC2N_04185 [Spirochaetota bacterium]